MSNDTRVQTILILAANPSSTSRLRLDEEVREIDEGLRRANKREQFKLEQKWAVRQRDFYRAILDHQPQIVHFSGHGAGEDGIVLEDEVGQPALVSADVLASQFEIFAPKGVECVVLNACYSDEQAQAIRQYVNYVIGMNTAVGDKAAQAFAVAFYDAIASGYEVEPAYKLGCSQMKNYMEEQTPVLLKKDLLSVPPAFLTKVIPPNPYQGLAAFGEEDAPFFFGRETFVNGLFEAVHKQPLVAVIGPSGSGKSSVIFAGLVPKLREQGSWLIETFRPGNQPFYQLASALVRLLEPELGVTGQLREAAGLASDIQQGRVALEQVISRITERNFDKHFLLIADQFEELYTLCQNKHEQEHFANVLLEAITKAAVAEPNTTKNFTLVFTLRADFYGHVLSYRPFSDVLQQFAPQLLSSMSREELQTAIEQPAQKSEVQLEAKLTQRILDDVGQEPGNLPLLEFALTRLWSLQQNRMLTHSAYDEIGGVKKALANHAEHIYNHKLNEEQQKQAQYIFLQLVRPGEGTEDTRRIATRAEVGENNWGLVSYLAGYEARLVVTGRNEQSCEETVEVVHEALIREWETLKTWMKDNRQFRAWQEQLRAAIHQWNQTKEDPGALLRGAPLAVAREWLQQRRNDLTQTEQDFIQQGIDLSDRLHKEEEERRQLELETAQKLAEASERRRKAAQMTTRVAMLATILVSGIAIFAFTQWKEANKLYANAQLQTLNQGAAYANREAADAFALNRKNARSLQLAALIKSLKAAGQLKKAEQLGLTEQDSKIQTVANLRQIVLSYNETGQNQKHNKEVIDVDFSSNNHIIASSGRDNTGKLWRRDGSLITTLTDHKDWVIGVSFDPKNSQILASASSDKTVKIWQLSRSIAKLIRTIKHDNEVAGVSMNRNAHVVSASGKSVYLRRLDGSLIATYKDTNEVYHVSFSPDGKMIALASGKDVKLWQPYNKSIAAFSGHSDSVIRVSFSPDGNTIASASADKTVKLWKLDGNSRTLIGHENRVLGVSFSSDGNTIASASADGTVRLWRQSDGKLVSILKGHNGIVTDVSFSPDQKTIASTGFDKTVRLWGNNEELNNLDHWFNRACIRLLQEQKNSTDVNTNDKSLCDNTSAYLR